MVDNVQSSGLYAVNSQERTFRKSTDLDFHISVSLFNRQATSNDRALRESE